MAINFYGKTKVPNNVKPVASSLRVAPDLFVGSNYYVSFTNNIAYPCRVLEIINEFSRTEVRIEIPIKVLSSKKYFDKNGNRTYNPTQENIVYAIEIGDTPEDAVKNQHL